MKLEDKIAESALAPVGSILPAPDVIEISRDGWYQTITPSTGSLQGNEVILSQVAAAEAEAVVRRAI